ncbi:hypothetical protein DSO57_1012708 [Entomophthora muscae]|uniref:Uncharacterized protein n=1 Tax=Entomophthora muscae TaxID=34485 RepID=A0ACC2SIZ0_9FUNG|nr:hypothetical protein DSO57_1012708 [Entomophthora muscae]
MASSNWFQRAILRLACPGKERNLVLETFAFICTHFVGGIVTAAFFACHVWLAVFSTRTSMLELGVLGWLSLEWMFLVWCRVEAGMVLKAKPGLTLGAKRRKQVERAILDSPDVAAIMSGWFLPESDAGLSKEQVREWLAWYLHGQHVQDLDQSQWEYVETHIGRLSTRMRFAALPAKRKLMKISLDSFSYQHKPLLFYLMIHVVQQLSNLVLWSMGFKHLREGSSSYWYLDGKSKHEPVVFAHGIGMGLSVYLVKIYQLLKVNPGRRVVLLEFPYISLSPVTAVPTIARVVDDVSAIVCRHGLPPCSFVGHSYGTVVVSWIMTHKPRLVRRSTLIDPVCFALWEPTLVKRFVYLSSPAFLQQLVHFFIARDLFVTNTITRHFNWIHNILLPEDISCPTTVVLSSHDFLINASAIKGYLQEHNATRPRFPLKIVMQKNHTHGSYLVNSKSTAQIIAKV